jgi:RNA polymerase sigma factor (sigma-70 family)
MAKQSLAVVSRLARALTKAETSTVSDCELLTRFVSDKDQAAFATVVARHTAMVLGVCRRSLFSLHDAEDACQAVFLLLAKKAGRTGWQSSAASWLYATARKVARNARVAAARRTRRDGRAVVAKSRSPIELMNGQELLAVLDEELDKLPSRYREPLVLCCLEGLARDEAAARLGVPVATLKSQLQRARKKLADALASRGCELGSVLLIVTAAAAGQASPKLLDSILIAAAGAPSESVAALARGIAMNGILGHVKLAVAFVGVALLGLAFAAALPIAAQPEKPNANRPVELAEKPDPKPAPAKMDSPGASPDLAQRLGTTRFRAEQTIGDARFSADGKRIVGHAGGTIYVWDAVEGTILRKIDTKMQGLVDTSRPGGGGGLADIQVAGLFVLAIHPKANRVAFGGAKNGKTHLQIWDFETGQALAEKLCDLPALKALAWTPDGKSLLERSDTEWETPTRKLIVRDDKLDEIRSHELPKGTFDRLTAVYPLPDSKQAIIWQSKGELPTVYDLESGKATRTFDYNDRLRQGCDVALSPDAQLLVATTTNGMALFDFATGKKLKELPVLRRMWETPRPLFSPDSKTVYVWDFQPIAYDTSSGERKWKVVAPTFISGGMKSRDLSRDGDTLLTCIGNSLALLDAKTGMQRNAAPSPCGAAEMVWSPDAKILFTRVEERWRERTWTAWEVATGKQLYHLLPPTSEDNNWKMLPGLFFMAKGNEVMTCLEKSNSSERAGPKEFLVFDTATGQFKRKLGDLLPEMEFLWMHPIGVEDSGAAVLMQGVVVAMAAPALGGGGLSKVENKHQTIRWNPLQKTKLQEWTVDGSDAEPARHYAPYCVVIRSNTMLPPVRGKAVEPATILCYSLADGKLVHELATEFQYSNPDRIQGNFLLTEGYDRKRVQRGASNFAADPTGLAYDLWILPLREKLRLFELPKSTPMVLGPAGQYVIRVLDDNSFEIHEPFVLKRAVAKISTPSSARQFEFSPDGGRVAVSLADTTVMIFDTGAWRQQIEEQIAKAMPAELSTLWDELAGDSATALRAARLLSRAGEEKAVSLLAAKLDAKKGSGEDITKQLIADLDADSFAAREKAEKALRTRSTQAESHLRKALAANPAAESKQRIEKLLKEIEAHKVTYKLTSDERREVLAVQVLTWVDTDSARRLLAKWAKGDPNAILTKAAGAAAGR